MASISRTAAKCSLNQCKISEANGGDWLKELNRFCLTAPDYIIVSINIAKHHLRGSDGIKSLTLGLSHWSAFRRLLTEEISLDGNATFSVETTSNSETRSFHQVTTRWLFSTKVIVFL